MTSLVAILALRTLCVTSQTNFQFDVRQTDRGGITFYPTGGQQSSQLPSQSTTLLFMVSPGIQVKGTYSNFQALLLRYAPQFVSGYTGLWPPQVVHRLNATYAIGNPKDLRLSSGANMTQGQLDPLVGLQTVPGLGNLVAQQPGTAPIGLTQITAFMEISKQLNTFWRISSRQTVNYVATNGSQASQFFQTGVDAPTGSVPQIAQTSRQFITKEAAEYKATETQSLEFGVSLSAVAMSNVGTYLGINPQVTWKNRLSELTDLTLAGGIYKYWLNPYPGVYDAPRYLPTGEISLQHKFADWGIPRLQGLLSVRSAPFFNVFQGYMMPRVQARAELRYAFTPNVTGNVSAREVLYDMPGYDLRRGSQKNMIIGNIGVNYNYSRALSFNLGGYSSLWSYEPSSTLQYDTLRQVYFVLSIRGKWQD
jgi:hypothetical protein